MLKTIMSRSAIIAMACALSFSAYAMADSAKRAIHIPSGDLAAALELLAKQSGSDLVYRPDQVRGLKTRGVNGELSTEEAVTRLLEGTPLLLSVDSTGAMLIALPTPVAPKEVPVAELNLREQPENVSGRIRLAQADEAPPSQNRPVQLAEVVVNLPEVLVEGNRSLNMDIQRTRDDPQPYVVFTREKIEQSGAKNVETFLRDRLPMNSNGLPFGQTINQGGSQSRFNLRGLGANQTLILVDGHRLSPGPSYGGTPFQSNLNGIPIAAVERIEVLPATASGIYGGSATGGVINIILRHDYAGTEVKATYGNSIESDVAQRRIDLASGFAMEGGKTNVLVSASFSDQNPLTLQERPELVERYYAMARANAPALLLPPNAPPLGATPNIRSADGSALVLDTGQSLNSSFTSVPVGYAGAVGDRGAALLANAGQYNLNLPHGVQIFSGGASEISQTPRDVAVRTAARREFSHGVRAFLEGSYNESDTSSVGVVDSGGALRPYRVSASAPNNPFTRDIIVTVPTDSIAGSRSTSIAHTRVLGGVIVSLPGKWHAEMDYTWTKVRHEASGVLPVSNGADTAAILTGAVDVLRDTRANPIDLSPFMTPGREELLQKVTFQDAALRLAGPVMELPAGPLTVSTLIEHRREAFADTTQVSPIGGSLFYPSRSATASSAYVETRVPVFSARNRVTGVQELEVQLAARVDEYRTRGATGFITVGTNAPIVRTDNETRSVNPTVALRYQPFEDLVFRSSYGTGFVAPDVSQLAGSIALAPVTVNDPRRGGGSTTLVVGQALQGGNPNLRPEESESWSVGFILTPRFIPNLRLSLDYTRIEKTDNIATYPTGLQGIVNDEALHPGRVQRGANLPGDPAGWAGPIVLLDATRFNIASALVEAYDLQLDYERRTNFGTLGFSTVATRQTHFKTRSIASQPTLENVGISYNNPQGFTGSAELRWQHRGWTAGWLARYYDDYLTTIPTLSTNAAAILLQGNGGRVPSQTYHDLFINWRPGAFSGGLAQVLEDTEFQLSLRNVFDKMPPFDASLFNGVRTLYSPLGDALGTTWQISMTKRF
jgi:iron complex outermembrane receptor protein